MNCARSLAGKLGLTSRTIAVVTVRMTGEKSLAGSWGRFFIVAPLLPLLGLVPVRRATVVGGEREGSGGWAGGGTRPSRIAAATAPKDSFIACSRYYQRDLCRIHPKLYTDK